MFFVLRLLHFKISKLYMYKISCIFNKILKYICLPNSAVADALLLSVAIINTTGKKLGEEGFISPHTPLLLELSLPRPIHCRWQFTILNTIGAQEVAW